MFPWSSSTHRGQEVRWWGRFQKKEGVQASSSRETLGILALFNQDSCPFFSLKSWDFNALLIYFKFIWKSEQDGWRREGGERKRGSRGLPTAILLSKCPQKPGLSQFKTRSQQLHPCLPHEWQDSKHLSHHVLLGRMHICRKVNWKSKWNLIPDTQI